mmetsp:Transcript_90170/g.259997  ORF Transcript_90170/g.259997 Transcript_90170/m.259997 type:complete len:250 (+) Transcript_90170:189-938(+)
MRDRGRQHLLGVALSQEAELEEATCRHLDTRRVLPRCAGVHSPSVPAAKVADDGVRGVVVVLLVVLGRRTIPDPPDGRVVGLVRAERDGPPVAGFRIGVGQICLPIRGIVTDGAHLCGLHTCKPPENPLLQGRRVPSLAAPEDGVAVGAAEAERRHLRVALLVDERHKLRRVERLERGALQVSIQLPHMHGGEALRMHHLQNTAYDAGHRSAALQVANVGLGGRQDKRLDAGSLDLHPADGAHLDGVAQ